MTEDELKAIEGSALLDKRNEERTLGEGVVTYQTERILALVAEVRRLRAILEDAEVIGCNQERTRFGAEITLSPEDLPAEYKRRNGAMLPERMRCSLCGCGLEPCDLPGGVCSGCDPEGSANAEARRCHIGDSDTDDEEQFECTLHQGHAGPCNLKRVED